MFRCGLQDTNFVSELGLCHLTVIDILMALQRNILLCALLHDKEYTPEVSNLVHSSENLT